MCTAGCFLKKNNPKNWTTKTSKITLKYLQSQNPFLKFFLAFLQLYYT